MKDAIFLNLVELQKKIKEFPPYKIVFWVGAGIDSSAPTSLPLGNELTDHILSLSCGSYFEKLIQAWETQAKFISDVCVGKVTIPDRPRLETIIEVVREFETHQVKKISVIDGLKSFSSSYIIPNHEHYVLAYFLHLGANIVTTNYGDFICAAYEDLYGKGTIRHEKNQLHIYKASNKWSSCIYHIHGISNDLKTLGDNLSNVKNRLPQSFKATFNNWRKNNHCIIYMGYSGLDTLDVNPFIQSFVSCNNATGVYIRHSSNGSVTDTTDKEKILLQAFSNRFVCPCITSDFLRYLKEFPDKDPHHKTTSPQKWEKTFNEHASEYCEDHSNTLMLGLCYKLGVNITSIIQRNNWFQNTTKCSNVDEWYKLYYSFVNATVIGDRKKFKIQGRKLIKNNDELAKIDYNAALGKTAQAVKNTLSPLETNKNIKEQLSTNQIIDWDISTPLNRHVDLLISKVLCFPPSVKKKVRKINTQNILPTLIECYNIIIDEGYTRVADVNQINTAHRALALCQILNYTDVDEAIKNVNIALANYADVSSINGVALSVLYLATIWLLNYCLRGNIESLQYANSNLDIAKKIIFGCRLFRYTKRYRKVKMLYIYLKYTPNF